MPQPNKPYTYKPLGWPETPKWPEEQRQEMIRLLEEILATLKRIEEQQPHRGTAF